MTKTTLRRRVVLPVALLVVAAACGAASDKKGTAVSSSSTGSTSTTSVTSAPESTSTSSSSSPTTPTRGSTTQTTGSTPPAAQPTSDGWTVQTFQAGSGATGKWSGTAQIRNTNTQARAGDFVFTLTRSGAVIAMLTGSLGTVPGGSIGSATLASEQNYTPGGYTYTFKATFGF